MQLRRLLLEEFRLYHHLELELGPAGLALHGANASGKSTLLEAIAMLATTRSARSGGEREVINWRSGEELGFPPFARVRGHVERLDDEVDVEIALQLDAGGSGQLQKAIRLNGRNVRAMDAVGSLKTVLFAPEDVALVSGSPSGRRRYLDLMISQVDGRYLRALSRYNRILEQRNSLLKSLGREGVSANSPTAAAQLAFWDEELVAFGSRLVARRMLSIRSLAAHAAERFATFGDER
ncbi:MAG: replication and repair protein RecF, partial [Thermomicrobiales bacterium]|nr:replication and repair protein RecF [Thermomicrobiales bacterium]